VEQAGDRVSRKVRAFDLSSGVMRLLTPSRNLLSRMTTLITVSLKSRQNTSIGASKKGFEVYCLTRVLKTISSRAIERMSESYQEDWEQDMRTHH